MVVRTAMFASLLCLAACTVGEVPAGAGDDGSGSGGGGGSGGGSGVGSAPTPDEQSFATVMQPLITKYGCAGCHNGVQTPNLTSFNALEPAFKAKPGASSLLVTEGSLTGGIHNGIMYFSAADQTTVANWIDSL